MTTSPGEETRSSPLSDDERGEPHPLACALDASSAAAFTPFGRLSVIRGALTAASAATLAADLSEGGGEGEGGGHDEEGDGGATRTREGVVNVAPWRLLTEGACPAICDAMERPEDSHFKFHARGASGGDDEGQARGGGGERGAGAEGVLTRRALAARASRPLGELGRPAVSDGEGGAGGVRAAPRRQGARGGFCFFKRRRASGGSAPREGRRRRDPDDDDSFVLEGRVLAGGGVAALDARRRGRVGTRRSPRSCPASAPARSSPRARTFSRRPSSRCETTACAPPRRRS